MKKRLVKIVAVTCSIVLGFALMPLMMVGCGNRQEFCHETVIVSLTQEASDKATLNGHIFTQEDFPGVVLKGVEDIWTIELGQPRILLLRLKYPGRESVLEAVETLRQLINVGSAGLNYFGTIR
ncbi:MAG: hypothetical protein FWE31_04555 [Firmicutes bacterium]|nr:hypothetical protein [Bacillota bacterium]